MESIEFWVEFFMGMVLLIGTGILIGHILKLENFSAERKMSRQSSLKNSDTPDKDTDGLTVKNDI
jgi:hypothetical protein